MVYMDTYIHTRKKYDVNTNTFPNFNRWQYGMNEYLQPT